MGGLSIAVAAAAIQNSKKKGPIPFFIVGMGGLSIAVASGGNSKFETKAVFRIKKVSEWVDRTTPLSIAVASGSNSKFEKKGGQREFK